jgi:hypothetical protein
MLPPPPLPQVLATLLLIMLCIVDIIVHSVSYFKIINDSSSILSNVAGFNNVLIG